MKKKYILILIPLFVVILIFIYFRQKNKNSVIEITPSKPTIKNNLEGEIKIDTDFEKSKYTFPAKLPTLTFVKKSIDRTYFESIKNKFGIEEDVQEFNDTFEGIKYFVNSKDKFLTATPKTAIIKYGLSTIQFHSVEDKKYTDEELAVLANAFVTNNGFYRTDQISFLNIQYLKRSASSEGLEKSNRNEAEVFGIGFNYSSNDYEIADNYSVKAPIYIEVLKNGEIFNSEIILIEDLKNGITEYQIKNYQEFINSLNQSKIISLEGDYYSVSDIKSINEIQKVSINSVRIAYYDDSKKDNFLQPIFIIDANIQIKGSSSNKAVLYLPAYK